MSVVDIRRTGRREREVIALARTLGLQLASVPVVAARLMASKLDWPHPDSGDVHIADLEEALAICRDWMIEEAGAP